MSRSSRAGGRRRTLVVAVVASACLLVAGMGLGIARGTENPVPAHVTPVVEPAYEASPPPEPAEPPSGTAGSGPAAEGGDGYAPDGSYGEGGSGFEGRGGEGYVPPEPPVEDEEPAFEKEAPIEEKKPEAEERKPEAEEKKPSDQKEPAAEDEEPPDEKTESSDAKAGLGFEEKAEADGNRRALKPDEGRREDGSVPPTPPIPPDPTPPDPTPPTPPDPTPPDPTPPTPPDPTPPGPTPPTPPEPPRPEPPSFAASLAQANAIDPAASGSAATDGALPLDPARAAAEPGADRVPARPGSVTVAAANALLAALASSGPPTAPDGGAATTTTAQVLPGASGAAGGTAVAAAAGTSAVPDPPDLGGTPRVPPPSLPAQVVNRVPNGLWFALGALAAFALLAVLCAAFLAARTRRTETAAAALRRRAITDPLTGTLNRRGFEERMAAELARARRTGRPLAVAYLDVVGLKSVNDTYGHHAGDSLLQATARLLRENTREEDAAARLGGDEWAVVLPEQDRQGAKSFARRLQAQLPDAQAGLGLEAPWSLTIGWSVFPEDGEDTSSLVAAADRRLYARRGIELGQRTRT